MLKGRREDLRSIWDQLFNDPISQWMLEDGSHVAHFTRAGTDENRENEWRRLEKVLDTKQEQNNALNQPGERIFAESQQLYKRDKDFTFAPRQFER